MKRFRPVVSALVWGLTGFGVGTLLMLLVFTGG
jgi:hypothetical protein